MVSKKKVNAIADEAVAALLDKGKVIVKPFWLARGHHTDPVTGEVRVTQIEGIRPDKVSPAERRVRARGKTVFHRLPIPDAVLQHTNPLSGKTRLVVVPKTNRKGEVVYGPELTAGWQLKLKGHPRGLFRFGPPVLTGKQQRMIRRYRTQYPELDSEGLTKKMVEDMITRLKKQEARAAA